MTDEINYKNNPLHGLGLKQLLTEIVDHYGFEILYAYLNINCFKTNPSVESSVKFLKKTDWAREKVELFYLYQFKNLPRVSSEQFSTPPRERIIPDGHLPREPKELSLEDAAQQREKKAKKAAEFSKSGRNRSGRSGSGGNSYTPKRRGNKLSGSRHGLSDKPDRKPSRPQDHSDDSDPWGNWKKKD